MNFEVAFNLNLPSLEEIYSAFNLSTEDEAPSSLQSYLSPQYRLPKAAKGKGYENCACTTKDRQLRVYLFGSFLMTAQNFCRIWFRFNVSKQIRWSRHPYLVKF